MAESDVTTIRGYELRLLRSTLSPTSVPLSQSQPLGHHLHSFIVELLNSIEAGNYLEALASEGARLVLGSPEFELIDSAESADRAYSELFDRVEAFVVYDSHGEEKACRVVMVMCVAIAALLWFTRCNLTGPLEESPKCSLPFKVSESKEMVEWEHWARNQLMSAGSDLLGKFHYLQYLVFAKMLLLRMKGLLFETPVSSTYGFRSISWWLARVLLIHQRVLDERSSSLFDLLQVYMSEALEHLGSLEKVRGYWNSHLQDEEASSIISIVHLEAGVLEYTYGRVDSCRRHFELAETAAGLELSLTGVLGFRTVHQVEPKAQMVLVTNASSLDGGVKCSSRNTNTGSHESGVNEMSDIYMIPKLVENDNEPVDGGKSNQKEAGGAVGVPLNPIQQAVVLAQCLLIEKSSRHDEMQRWDMAPYIEAIDSQESTYFVLRCYCDILRVRWEASRGRTKTRALEMMDRLVESVTKPDSGVPERIPFFCAVYFPTIPALRKEYGELLVSCGLVGEAITVFESLELWDNLIYCNCLLGKKAAAVDLIKLRLSERPNDPRLWCSLGDVTNNDDCYRKALEVSDNKSARALRALARSAYNRGEYEKSKNLWESAMVLNSLFADGWFGFGAAALKARDVEKALDAFTRAVQLDPENGEAWNNIACLHMIKKKNKESFIAFKEALKFKRESWQMWENYSHVAMDVGNISQALEAVRTILNLTKNKRIDVELLERIMQDLERRTLATQSCTLSVPGDQQSSTQTCLTDSAVDSNNESAVADRPIATSRETDHLMELLGKILQQIVKSESTADIWGLYARWHRMKGDLLVCSEALLKQVRSYQGSDLWNNRERISKFARVSVDLCKVYMEISSSTGSRRELFSAEMLLKSTIKQATANFPDTEELAELESCLDLVKVKLQPNPASA